MSAVAPSVPRAAAARVEAQALAAAACAVAFLAVTLVVRAWTETGPGSWWAAQETSSWTPVGAATGALSLVPYPCFALATWLVVRRGLRRPGVPGALVAQVAQVVVLLVWVRLLFVDERPDAAVAGMLVWIVAVVLAGVGMFRVHPVAGVLVVPALVWIAAMVSVTAGILVLR